MDIRIFDVVSLPKFVKTNEMLEATADDSTPPAENCPTQKDADGTKIFIFYRPHTLKR